MTAIELLVVLAILAVIAGASMPHLLTAIQIYRFNGAVWRVASDIRYAQSMAVARSTTYGWHWGGDAGAPGPNQSRVEQWPGGAACSWPPVTDSVSTNGLVVTNWYDLATDYRGVTIVSVTGGGAPVGALAFNTRGASQAPSPCPTVVYPVTITMTSAHGRTRTIVVQSAGNVSIQ